MARSGFALVATLLISAPTLALAALPDRSALSYEENVTINTACASALKRGDGAFNDCVSRQLGQLETHPSPDRSVLSAELNQAIESKCAYFRRSSIGDYNDCLKKAIEAPAEPTQAADEPLDKKLESNYGQVFTEEKIQAAQDKPAPTMVADTSLAPPASVLPKRPDHLGKDVLQGKDLFKRVKESIFVVVATR